MFMINESEPDDVNKCVTTNEMHPRLQTEIYSNIEKMISHHSKQVKDYDAEKNNDEDERRDEEWSQERITSCYEASSDIDQKSVHSEEEESDYNMDSFSSSWIKDIAQNEYQRFMMERKRRSSAELSSNILGPKILYTESGEKYINRNGFRVHFVPIEEPQEEEIVEISDTSKYIFLVGLGVLYVITLLCSELLYVEYGKLGYIPFGIISLFIVYGVTYFICRADLPNFDPTQKNPQIHEVALMA